jgi:predicted GNAT superfamily acetyltransferase
MATQRPGEGNETADRRPRTAEEGPAELGGSGSRHGQSALAASPRGSAAVSLPAERFTIRPLASIAEYRACQEIQRRAWAIAEDGYLMPVSLLVSVQKHGGLVLGAFDGDQMVGFAFAYLGAIEGELGLYSQLTGVVPTYQGRGVGELLKQTQREEALRRGLRVIAWAFDPLQAGNARFNLHKLGARCRRYEVDMYGSRTDALNVGLATDRLIAEWWVAGEGETERRDDGANEEQGTRLLVLEPEGEWRRPMTVASVVGERLELDIPPDVAALKRQRPDLAALWQQRVREAFQMAFAHGYVAVDFLRMPGRERCWYVLEHGVMQD